MAPFAASGVETLRSAVRAELERSSPEVRDWCTNDTLQRYLAARNGDVDKAAAMLAASLKWRDEFQPHKISWSEIAFNASTGRIELLHETDSLGRYVTCCERCLRVMSRCKWTAQITLAPVDPGLTYPTFVLCPGLLLLCA